MNELLGRGPVAEVYAVGGDAVKVFPGRFDRRTLAAVQRDRARLATVAGPVLPVTGVEVVDGRHALRMERCVESLAGRVRRDGPLPSREVAALCTTLSRALAAARGAGVLHGGVSPENVLFRVSGEAVLADFGVAQRQAFRRDPLHGIEWVSPETLRTGEADSRNDLYGLGAVLHFALTGESPHPSRIGELTGERILRVIGDPVPAISRPDVPVELSTAIGRLLSPDPDRRLAPVAQEPSPAPSSTGSPVWRWVAAAAVVVAAVAAAVVLRPRTAVPPPASAAPPAATSASVPVITLAEPTDLGDHVALSWTATDDRMIFFVFFWQEGGARRSVPAEFERTKTVPVRPGGKYCFLVRGTNSRDLVESLPRSLNGAVCDG